MCEEKQIKRNKKKLSWRLVSFFLNAITFVYIYIYVYTFITRRDHERKLGYTAAYQHQCLVITVAEHGSIASFREWKKQKRSLDVRYDERIGNILYFTRTFFNICPLFCFHFFFLSFQQNHPRKIVFPSWIALNVPFLSLSNRVHGASVVKTSRLVTKALKHGDD